VILTSSGWFRLKKSNTIHGGLRLCRMRVGQKVDNNYFHLQNAARKPPGRWCRNSDQGNLIAYTRNWHQWNGILFLHTSKDMVTWTSTWLMPSFRQQTQTSNIVSWQICHAGGQLPPDFWRQTAHRRWMSSQNPWISFPLSKHIQR
jgi:hypothetical protein